MPCWKVSRGTPSFFVSLERSEQLEGASLSCLDIPSRIFCLFFPGRFTRELLFP